MREEESAGVEAFIRCVFIGNIRWNNKKLSLAIYKDKELSRRITVPQMEAIMENGIVNGVSATDVL